MLTASGAAMLSPLRSPLSGTPGAPTGVGSGSSSTVGSVGILADAARFSSASAALMKPSRPSPSPPGEGSGTVPGLAEPVASSVGGGSARRKPGGGGGGGGGCEMGAPSSGGDGGAGNPPPVSFPTTARMVEPGGGGGDADALRPSPGSLPLAAGGEADPVGSGGAPAGGMGIAPEGLSPAGRSSVSGSSRDGPDVVPCSGVAGDEAAGAGRAG